MSPNDPPVWVPYAVRMANEGLPIGAIARALDVPRSDARTALTVALQLGKIFEMPTSDWPPTARREDRVATNPPQPGDWLRSVDDDKLCIYCIRVFKLTPLQGAVFSMLLRHNEATKEMIHAVIEDKRQQKNVRSDMEETNIKMVDVVICHIRRKLKPYNDNVPPIQTLWGSGYYIPKEYKHKFVDLITSFEG